MEKNPGLPLYFNITYADHRVGTSWVFFQDDICAVLYKAISKKLDQICQSANYFRETEGGPSVFFSTY